MKYLALLILLTGCLHMIPKATIVEERDLTRQAPMVGGLPHDAGMLFAYTFTDPPTEDEAYNLLAYNLAGIYARNQDPDSGFSFDTTDKVVIVVYEAPGVFGAVTADFAKSAVELWLNYPDKDWYIKKTYDGDIEDTLMYLVQGFTGAPTVEEGRPEEEFIAPYGKRQGV